MKKFFLKDQSGRGICATLSLEQFSENGWDLDYKNDDGEDSHDPTLGEWLEDADIGDEYHHDDENCTIMCIENTRSVDVRPNPERFDPAYRVFGYGRKGRISAGMTVKIAGTNQSGRVVMPSSEPNHWVINMGGRNGIPKVVHEDNLITRGG